MKPTRRNAEVIVIASSPLWGHQTLSAEERTCTLPQATYRSGDGGDGGDDGDDLTDIDLEHINLVVMVMVIYTHSGGDDCGISIEGDGDFDSNYNSGIISSSQGKCHWFR